MRVLGQRLRRLVERQARGRLRHLGLGDGRGRHQGDQAEQGDANGAGQVSLLRGEPEQQLWQIRAARLQVVATGVLPQRADQSPSSSSLAASRLAPADTTRLPAGPHDRHEGSSTDRLVVAAGCEVREQRHQLGALHVGLEGARRPPAHERQPEERARRNHAVLDRRQHLLLALGALDVGLVRRARVLPDPREAERLLAVEVLLALPEAKALPEVVERRRADPVLHLHVDAPEGVDQLGEVLEVHLDQVVDLDAVAHEALDGPDHQRRPAEGVGRVDLLAAVPGDLRERVARDGELAHAAEGGPDEHDRVRARRALL